MIKTQSRNRFIIVLCISITGVVTSYKFLRPEELFLKSKNARVYTAMILKKKNEVERQHPNHIIWEGAFVGDNLERGEKIKTASNSTAVIKFLNSTTTLNIDPDSLVVIDQNQDKVALRILAGNLFVNQEKNNEKIDVFSGEGNDKKIELKNAEAAIGFNKSGPSLDIIKGGATSEGKEIKSSASTFGETLPNYGETLYYNEKDKKTVSIRWTPFNQSEYHTSLEVGKTRESLNESDIHSINTKDGFAEILPFSGTLFWKLKVTNLKSKKQISSSVMKFNMEKIIPPLLVSPGNNEMLRIIPNEDNQIDFKWNLFIPLQKILIEFSQDQLFEKKILTDAVTKQTYYETKNLKAEGRYYWRVIGNIPGSTELVTSRTYSFDLVNGKKINGPNLVSPENNFTFHFDELSKKNYISLSWKPEIEAVSYILSLKINQAKKEISLNTTNYILDFNGPDTIVWSVQSVDEQGVKSTSREARTLKVVKMDEMLLLKIPPPEISYVQDIPSFDISWSKKNEARTYRVLYSKSSNFVNSEKQETTESSFHLTPSSAGQVFIKIEAYDNELNLIAQSKTMTTFLKEKALPDSPQFEQGTPSPILTNLEGDVTVRFRPLPPGLKLQTELRASNEILIEKHSLESTSISLKSLMPGKYFIIAKVSDTYGRVSEYGSKRIIIVPEKSTIQAPKIKNVIIK